MRVIKSETTGSVSAQQALWGFLASSSCLCSVVVVICGACGLGVARQWWVGAVRELRREEVGTRTRIGYSLIVRDTGGRTLKSRLVRVSRRNV